jgi:hypothetical protein
MLSVAICCYQAVYQGKRAQDVVDAGLERAPFAQIDGMAQDADARQQRKPRKERAMASVASVVDEDDGAKALGGQFGYKALEALLGLPYGQQNRAAAKGPGGGLAVVVHSLFTGAAGSDNTSKWLWDSP